MTKEFVYNKLIEARKTRNKVFESLYGNLLNKIMVTEKDGRHTLPISEETVNDLAQKEIKEIEETLSFYKEPCQNSIDFEAQIAELKQYLPKNLTEEEVISIIKDLSTSEKNIGKLTGLVCKAVGSRFDRSMAASLVKITVSQS